MNERLNENEKREGGRNQCVVADDAKDTGFLYLRKLPEKLLKIMKRRQGVKPSISENLSVVQMEKVTIDIHFLTIPKLRSGIF